MKRICCFCESWESGGIESFINNMLTHMDLSDLEVDIVAAVVKESVFTAGLEHHGVRFISLSGKQRHPANRKLFRDLLRERNYDAVHFNLFQGLSLSYVQVARQEGVPVRIAHSHNTALRKSLGRQLKLMLHKLGAVLYTGEATDLWACSEEAAKFLFHRKVLEQKGFTFIPNGIEAERFRFDSAERNAVRAELGVADAFVIGSVGRLCYQKNQDFLLDIFAQTVPHRPESRLLLVGEGELEQHLREKAQRLGIADRVIFYGVTDRVERLFWAMDAFVFPSRFEGLGIVAVEAQASGLPVLCSREVPKEAHVSDLIKALSLDEQALWVEALLKLPVSAEGREYAADVIRQAGFDVQSAAGRIFEKYREK